MAKTLCEETNDAVILRQCFLCIPFDKGLLQRADCVFEQQVCETAVARLMSSGWES